MLDIKLIRENPDYIRQACTDKQLDPTVIDELLEADQTRRELQMQVDDIRQQVNANADTIKKQVSKGDKPDPDLVKKGKELKKELKEVEPKLKFMEESFEQLMYRVPNIPADDVPVGADESENEVIRTSGELPEFDFKPLDHQTLMENLGILDTKKAVAISGFRSYMLQGDGLLLEQAILHYSIKLLNEKGFTPMSAPSLVNKQAMWGTGYFPWGEEDHYYTQDDQILAGTSEVALTSFHQNTTLAEKDLPIKMAGLSPCFRREVGTHGKDTQGIIRVHQFNKVEQVVLTAASEEETRSWHETMLGTSELLLQNLGLPYQVLLMCTGDMGAGQRKKYDIETWFPAQDKYRETHSASYFNDFQARRLNIKYQALDGTTKYVYTLNNTMAATPRLLAAVIENYQQPDGSIRVPEVLQPFMGKEVIGVEK